MLSLTVVVPVYNERFLVRDSPRRLLEAGPPGNLTGWLLPRERYVASTRTPGAPAPIVGGTRVAAAPAPRTRGSGVARAAN